MNASISSEVRCMASFPDGQSVDPDTGAPDGSKPAKLLPAYLHFHGQNVLPRLTNYGHSDSFRA